MVFWLAGGLNSVHPVVHPANARPVTIRGAEIFTSPAPIEPKAQEVFIQRFRREAQVAARIRHPNAVAIHDIGVIEASGEPFLVMELLEGHDLKHELEMSILEPIRCPERFEAMQVPSTRP